jgi:uncharacterized membrane protein YbaN (DUF454 family)
VFVVMAEPIERTPQTPANGAKLLAWRIAGIVSLALGVLGIVLPLVPTTPFLLLAAFCFGRGSERLLKWLLGHPRFGPTIREWNQSRSISRRAKVLAAFAMASVVAITILLETPRVVLITQVIVLSLVGAFVFTRPSSS